MEQVVVEMAVAAMETGTMVVATVTVAKGEGMLEEVLAVVMAEPNEVGGKEKLAGAVVAAVAGRLHIQQPWGHCPTAEAICRAHLSRARETRSQRCHQR